MTDLPFPLAGGTLIVGPSGVGKTRLTARALDAWVDCEGAEGVVVLEFAPEFKRDGRVLGGRLDRFTTISARAWVGVLDAHAPRVESKREHKQTAVELARDNAERAEQLLDAAPAPRAVFINDATIPLQSDTVRADRLTAYCERAECVVMNAFESDELGTDDRVSRRERDALAALRSWADRTVALE